MTWRRREQAREGKEPLGGEDGGATDLEKPLESSKALKGKKHEKSSRFNARRWTIQTRGVSMGHATDARRATPHDISRDHYGDHKSPSDGTLRCGVQVSRSVGLDFEVVQVLRDQAPASDCGAAKNLFRPGVGTSRDGWQSSPRLDLKNDDLRAGRKILGLRRM
jgi:hypothetical protein